ncbi:YcgL domain-containing protein [Kushneria phosphatilytica]|uniref:YcgL domain-containing protein FY550_10720 n=1 Tax=Kushneria phosphatilytica TaxID=657387 RepID=A0A1S1NUN8_9GAMM|nr:YcgL domain-containing protein [Kushneria phosphatilytica]OHV10256.1 hypothetical protein BH688_09660 [Kushneria phosphatilytica]QEL11556.1 YcgL domain-containing protein [Kushneria phosphatilytica]
MKGLLCDIYRSSRREEMYLYVERARGLEDVPEALLQQFGSPQRAVTLLLSHERPLARADVSRVIESIRSQGYYLQMPPNGNAQERDLAFFVGPTLQDDDAE